MRKGRTKAFPPPPEAPAASRLLAPPAPGLPTLDGPPRLRRYAAEIAHSVSTLKRKAIVERAAEVRARLRKRRRRRRAAAPNATPLGGTQGPGLPHSHPPSPSLPPPSRAQLNIKVLNAASRLRSEEDE